MRRGEASTALENASSDAFDRSIRNLRWMDPLWAGGVSKWSESAYDTVRDKVRYAGGLLGPARTDQIVFEIIMNLIYVRERTK